MWADVSDPHLEQGAVLRHERETGGAVSCGRAVLDCARRGIGVSECLGITCVRGVLDVAVAFVGAGDLVLTSPPFCLVWEVTAGFLIVKRGCWSTGFCTVFAPVAVFLMGVRGVLFLRGDVVVSAMAVGGFN